MAKESIPVPDREPNAWVHLREAGCYQLIATSAPGLIPKKPLVSPPTIEI